MKRNLETRIAKLETGAGKGDKALLLWRRPSEDLACVVNAAREQFAPGDRVMCAVWYGGDAAPLPAWHDDLPQGLSHREREYLYRRLHEISGQPERHVRPTDAELEWSRADLLYLVLRVPT